MKDIIKFGLLVMAASLGYRLGNTIANCVDAAYEKKYLNPSNR